MTLEEIKTAVDAGNRVHWVNSGYVVTRDGLGQYLITFTRNGSAIGLTSRDGTHISGREAEFSEPIQKKPKLTSFGFADHVRN